MNRTYITTSIPYVNGEPHIGHALELVQADVLARHSRARSRPTRLLTGTDDNALKNVAAARAAGVDVRSYVDANAARFAGLQDALDLSVDDFIRTSVDPRHRRGVERLWRECAAAGDFYRHRYEGLYCQSCEAFYLDDELVDGRCPEHGAVPDRVSEENWFFRLSAYQDRLLKLISDDEVRIVPAPRRNEILGLLRGGLRDISVSRSAERAGGWGIPVPDDPSQVVYVWWDALANYVTALDYGGNGADYRDWWVDSSARVHVIGKDIVRFHAVYWLALLLSARQPLPTTIFVHDFLSADGARLSKSLGHIVDPYALADRYGVDVLRWWFVRDVAAVGETDFTEERLVTRANQDLANTVGNLVNRTLSLVNRYRGGIVPSHDPVPAAASLPARIDAALTDFDFRQATQALCDAATAGNRYVEERRPWELAGAELAETLGVLVATCRIVAAELEPFCPAGAARLRDQLGTGDSVGAARPVFPRLHTPTTDSTGQR